MAPLPDVLYERDGDAFLPTILTRGPWSADAQHAGPPSALLAHAIEAAAGIADSQLVRIALDVLRPVPLTPLTVTVRHVRPGKRVEQLEAELHAGDTVVMRARAWRMRSEAVELPGDLATPDAPPPPPEAFDTAPVPPFFVTGAESYASALEWRFFGGDWMGAGPAGVWTRMRASLLPDEPITPLEHLLTMTDAASGISATLDWNAWTFMNVDLSVALERPPAGEWLAMDARTRPGARGAGVCTATLADRDGRVGSSSAALLIAPR